MFKYCKVVELLNRVFMDDTFHPCCNSSHGVYFPSLLVLSVTTTLEVLLVWVENSVEIINMGHTYFLVKGELPWVQYPGSFPQSS